MKNARKYILNMNDVMSCGIGSEYNNLVQYNMLDEFTVAYNTTPPTSYTYPEITTEDLKLLSVLEYEKRVIDYIDVMEIDDTYEKENLFNTSVVEEDDCSFYCQLNPNFLVYKFLSGIRVIDIGKVNGTAQYRIYPSSANPDDYSWKTNETFLNLDQNGLYNVEIRDYFENVELCKIVKLVSMPLLIPSTTINIQSKLVRLNQISQNDMPDYAYKSGCIEFADMVGVTEPLTNTEKIKIDYVATTTAVGTIVGGDMSTICLTCKPNGSTVFEEYDYISNSNGTSPKTGFVEMCYGDTLCYSVMVQNATYGSDLNGDFSLTSVNGLGTVYPQIDTTNCSVSVSKTIPALTTFVKFDYTSGCTATEHTIDGTVEFSNPIPEGQCISVSLVANVGYVNGGEPSLIISCKPDGGSSYIDIVTLGRFNTSSNPILEMCYGDSLCYNIDLTVATSGEQALGHLNISDVSGSFGVNPIIDTTEESCYNIDDCIEFQQLEPIVVSVCRNLDTIEESNGSINIYPALEVTSQVSIDFVVSQCQSTNIGQETFKIYCKPSYSSDYDLIYDIQNDQYGEYEEQGVIHMCQGDSLCYENMIDNGHLNNRICSLFYISSVSSGDINVSIDNGENKDRDLLSIGF